MSQVEPYFARVEAVRELRRARPGVGAAAARTHAGKHAADQSARSGGQRLRPVVVPDAIMQGLAQWTAPEDGSVSWVDEDQHLAARICRWDSWEWWATLFPAVRFSYSWAFPPPDNSGLTESGNTNVWGELYERYSTDELYATEAEAFAALDELGYTLNQESYGGPEGVALFGARGEWHRYHLRRWNESTLRYRFSDPSTDATVTLELVDASGATVRSASIKCYCSQLLEITETYPFAGEAGEIHIEVDPPSEGAGADATDILITPAPITGDYDGDWAVPGLNGFPTWPNSYTEYWQKTDSQHHEQMATDTDEGWTLGGAAGPQRKIHGLKISGTGLITDQLFVAASLYYAEDIRAVG